MSTWQVDRQRAIEAEQQAKIEAQARQAAEAEIARLKLLLAQHSNKNN